MCKIRVLIVDDSCVVRRILADVLNSDPEIEVIDALPNGLAGVEAIERLSPDVVTLDIEMPVMNGLDALTAIRKIQPSLPVIMFSTLTERGASATLDALALGASDYVTKPANVGSVLRCQEILKEQLVPKIKALYRIPRVSQTFIAPTRPRVQESSFSKSSVEVVAVGVSTGGPKALSTLLTALPADFPVPIVIVQHMPPTFTRLLAERLDSQCQITVDESVDEQVVRAGGAYFAPGDFHMTVRRFRNEVRLFLNQQPKENSCRPAVDVLFRSVADTYGPGVLAVVLTGMGQDGLLGCKQIREAGGRVIAQDESSSVVWGMPGAVVKAGLADEVLPIDDIAQAILEKVNANQRRCGNKRGIACT